MNILSRVAQFARFRWVSVLLGICIVALLLTPSTVVYVTLKNELRSQGQVGISNVVPPNEPKIKLHVFSFVSAETASRFIPIEAFNINLICVADMEKIYAASEGIGMLYTDNGLAYVENIPRARLRSVTHECGNYVLVYTNP